MGWTANSEQLVYETKLAPGLYEITTRVASAVGDASYTIQVDEHPIAQR